VHGLVRKFLPKERCWKGWVIWAIQLWTDRLRVSCGWKTEDVEMVVGRLALTKLWVWWPKRGNLGPKGWSFWLQNNIWQPKTGVPTGLSSFVGSYPIYSNFVCQSYNSQSMSCWSLWVSSMTFKMEPKNDNGTTFLSKNSSFWPHISPHFKFTTKVIDCHRLSSPQAVRPRMDHHVLLIICCLWSHLCTLWLWLT
jgi:hypothetical protein